MAKYLGWISTTALTALGLVMGILDADFGPPWLWFAIGIACGFLAAFTFKSVWRSDDEPQLKPSIRQRAKTGKNSNVVQSTGDVTIKGNMGDRN